ncbi:hypothetical protein ACLGL1_01345 [Peptococcus simiae]|uniref:hypothetical protein n=1 Tax=Peptococcus simiae TaxID=1643805 RepID=UPI0039811040
MAKKKRRVNPRRKPASQADVARAKKQAERNAVIGTIAIPLMAAHDAYGFGPERLSRLLDRMLALYADYEADRFDMDEALDWLRDYTGIDMQEVIL